MSRSTLVSSLVLTLSLAAGSGWMDLVPRLFDEILLTAGDPTPVPPVPEDGNPEGGPGMDPWG